MGSAVAVCFLLFCCCNLSSISYSYITSFFIFLLMVAHSSAGGQQVGKAAAGVEDALTVLLPQQRQVNGSRQAD
jgi:hypothetical protein